MPSLTVFRSTWAVLRRVRDTKRNLNVSSAMGEIPSQTPFLLRHLHCSLSTLSLLYEKQGVARKEKSKASLNSMDTVSSGASTVGYSSFPPEPMTETDGEHVIEFFCRELKMGVEALKHWRKELQKRSQRSWEVLQNPQESTQPLDCINSENVPKTNTGFERDHRSIWLQHISSCVSADIWAEAMGRSTLKKSFTPQNDRRLYFYPRPQDTLLMQYCITQLKSVISPFVTLSPPPRSIPRSRRELPTADCAPPFPSRVGWKDESKEDYRPFTYETCSTFYATRHIPAGMFLLSIPTAAGAFANPPLTHSLSPFASADDCEDNDPYLTYFREVDDLVGQLCLAANLDLGEQSSSSSLNGYVEYLKQSVVPCRNLPFIQSKKELFDMLQPFAAAQLREGKATGEREEVGGKPIQYCSEEQVLENSVAYELWSFFHEKMKGRPLSPVLCKHFQLDTEGGEQGAQSISTGLAEYHWWVSVVLSRRLGASCLIPLLDKLNHSPLPNCAFTMASPVEVGEADKAHSTTNNGSVSSRSLFDTMTGLDVFHNLLSGTPSIHAYEPYTHLYAIRDILPGEALTLSYVAPSHSAYRPASTLSLEAAVNGIPVINAALGKDIEAGLSSKSLLAEASRLNLFHPGTHHVDTVEGQGSWRLQWGFVPKKDSVYSASDLHEVSMLLAEKRVEERKKLFPLTPSEKAEYELLPYNATQMHQELDDNSVKVPPSVEEPLFE